MVTIPPLIRRFLFSRIYLWLGRVFESGVNSLGKPEKNRLLPSSILGKVVTNAAYLTNICSNFQLVGCALVNKAKLRKKMPLWLTSFSHPNFSLQMFLKGEMTITCDEAFRNAISDFFEVVLESDRIASMVKSGSCSMYDIREVFITNIEKRVSLLSVLAFLSFWNAI